MKRLLFMTFVSTVLFHGSIAQVLTFGFDNAGIAGGTVSDTLVIGGSTYVLSAVHSTGNNATLYNATPSDLIFKYSTNDNLAHNWHISLSENGSPKSFYLVAVGYRSIAQFGHQFSLINHLGSTITASATVNAYMAGDLPINNSSAAANIPSFDINGLTGNSTTDVGFHNIRISFEPVNNTQVEYEFTNSPLLAAPNPTSGQTLISLPESANQGSIRVTNAVGLTVLEEAILSSSQQIIEIPGKPGIYFVTITTIEGQRFSAKVYKN